MEGRRGGRSAIGFGPEIESVGMEKGTAGYLFGDNRDGKLILFEALNTEHRHPFAIIPETRYRHLFAFVYRLDRGAGSPS